MAKRSAALDGILRDGMTLAVGSFGLCGIPEALIAAVREHGARALVIASNNAGIDGAGLGLLLESRQVRKMIGAMLLVMLGLSGSIMRVT